MSKKVLIISSSPRKGGNSDTLCDEFAKGALEGENIVEKIFLKDKKIGYCIGCGKCVSNQGKCSQKDDMEEIMGKMIEADVIVLATPVYFYSMSAQLKTFIDRVCSFYTMLENKEFYFIMTAADDDSTALKRTVESLRGFTYCIKGAKEAGIIYGTGMWKIGDVKNSEELEEAFEMGRYI